MSSFINVEKEKNIKIIRDLIDFENYLGLLQDRSRLIEFGVALGLDHPVKLNSKTSLSRAEYVHKDHELETILTCATIYHMKPNQDINDVLSEENIFNNADECLNRGLEVIEYQINNMPTNNHKYQLLNDLDTLFDKILSNIAE